MNRLIRLPEVLEKTGLSRSHAYELMRRKQFPAPYPIGERARAWSEKEVDQWITDRIEEGKQKEEVC